MAARARRTSRPAPWHAPVTAPARPSPDAVGCCLEGEEVDRNFMRCETFEAPIWGWAHLDSNQGPTGYEPAALTAELWAQGSGAASYSPPTDKSSHG